jgi:hypothetical protein
MIASSTKGFASVTAFRYTSKISTVTVFVSSRLMDYKVVNVDELASGVLGEIVMVSAPVVIVSPLTITVKVNTFAISI